MKTKFHKICLLALVPGLIACSKGNWEYNSQSTVDGLVWGLTTKSITPLDFCDSVKLTVIYEDKCKYVSVCFYTEPFYFFDWTKKETRVKFDNREPYTVGISFAGDSGRDRQLLYISSKDVTKFVSDMYLSDTLIIQLPFFDMGTYNLEFNIRDLLTESRKYAGAK